MHSPPPYQKFILYTSLVAARVFWAIIQERVVRAFRCSRTTSFGLSPPFPLRPAPLCRYAGPRKYLLSIVIISVDTRPMPYYCTSHKRYLRLMIHAVCLCKTRDSCSDPMHLFCEPARATGCSIKRFRFQKPTPVCRSACLRALIRIRERITPAPLPPPAESLPPPLRLRYCY